MTTQTLTLADFLLARIAEDERRYSADPSEYGYGHAFRMAECEAKRRIVEEHRDGGESQGYVPPSHKYGDLDHACVTCGTFGEYGEPWPCDTIKAVALPYADHADFRDEWRP